MDNEFMTFAKFEEEHYKLKRKMFRLKWFAKGIALILFYVNAAIAGYDVSKQSYGHATFMILSAFWMSKLYFDEDWS